MSELGVSGMCNADGGKTTAFRADNESGSSETGAEKDTEGYCSVLFVVESCAAKSPQCHGCPGVAMAMGHWAAAMAGLPVIRTAIGSQSSPSEVVDAILALFTCDEGTSLRLATWICRRSARLEKVER